jgi:hypothetical protein
VLRHAEQKLEDLRGVDDGAADTWNAAAPEAVQIDSAQSRRDLLLLLVRLDEASP